MKMQLKPLRWFALAMIIVVLIFLTTADICRGRVNDFDIIIRGGRIVDGTGSEAYRADVGIKNGRITEIGKLPDGKSGRIINAEGMVVAPGFIDIHTHTDRQILKRPSVENYIRQGATTVVGGNCGSSTYPVGEFLKKVEDKGTALNFALLVGHGAIRKKVIGKEDRQPTPEELNEMKQMVAQAMLDGAVGMSSGLTYVPGTYTRTDELVELSKVAARYGGFYATHMRDEGRGLIKAVREAIEIGKRSKIGVQISHHKVMGKSMWNSSIKMLEMVDKAIDDGLDITLDQYPYTATSTNLTVLFPSWALEGGQNRLKERLNNRKVREKIKEAIVDNILFGRGGGDTSSIVIASCSAERDLEGKSIAEITRMRRKEPTADNAAETIMDLQYAGGASAIYHCLCEDDVEQIMKHPEVMHASDGSAVTFGQAKPHPRNYGTFPRVLARYVREKKMISLPEAVRKMTSLPAQRLKLKERGTIKAGMFADIVIFNPKTVTDKGTWENPHQYAEGIPYVLVNGEPVIDDNKRTEVFPGTVLYGLGKK
jgi:N-acyl-D-aspartate/D-glutamate deacylase